jgi:hypothetical protein
MNMYALPPPTPVIAAGVRRTIRSLGSLLAAGRALDWNRATLRRIARGQTEPHPATRALLGERLVALGYLTPSAPAGSSTNANGHEHVDGSTWNPPADSAVTAATKNPRKKAGS